MGALFGSSVPSAPLVTAYDPEAERRELEAREAEERVTALARRRRGRAGTVATSARGILGPGRFAVARRSLLGE